MHKANGASCRTFSLAIGQTELQLQQVVANLQQQNQGGGVDLPAGSNGFSKQKIAQVKCKIRHSRRLKEMCSAHTHTHVHVGLPPTRTCLTDICNLLLFVNCVGQPEGE